VLLVAGIRVIASRQPACFSVRVVAPVHCIHSVGASWSIESGPNSWHARQNRESALGFR
jgi:hypothetical protein